MRVVLADKEFRYLRTVRSLRPPFTRASIQCFRLLLTYPINLLALGRRQPLYFGFHLSRDRVLVTVALGCFAAAPLRGRPLLLNYGARLPSSLTRVLSNALVSSTHLPVSVFTVRSEIWLAFGFGMELFSAPLNLTSLAPKSSLRRLSLYATLSGGPAWGLARNYQTVRDQILRSVPPLPISRVWNIYQMSIGYALLALP